MQTSMHRTAILCAAILAAAAASSGLATPGKLGSLPHGLYVCSLPGNASGPAWEEIPSKNFRIENASTYHTEEGSGIYLMTGNEVLFTRGPMKGLRFERTGNTTLIWLDENRQRSRIRCIRGGGTAG